MKKLFILACMFAFATTAFAEQAKNAPKASYSGVIEQYDAATRTLTVKRKDKHGEFVITDASEVVQNKAKADASALTAGHKVEVEFVMDGAKKIARKVKVGAAASSK